MTTITIGAELLSKATRLLDKLDPDMVFTASFAGEVSGIVLLLKDALAAPATAPEQPTLNINSIPVEYQYHYPDGTWRCSNGREINGSRPTASRALYAEKDKP